MGAPQPRVQSREALHCSLQRHGFTVPRRCLAPTVPSNPPLLVVLSPFACGSVHHHPHSAAHCLRYAYARHGFGSVSFPPPLPRSALGSCSSGGGERHFRWWWIRHFLLTMSFRETGRDGGGLCLSARSDAEKGPPPPGSLRCSNCSPGALGTRSCTVSLKK
jgi:hypothetical protein